MKKRIDRLSVLVGPEFFEHIREEQALWYETPDQIEAKLHWGLRKRRLLRWVRLHMGRRLTARERQYVELYFFRGLSCRDIGALLKVNHSSVSRGIRRALNKLKHAAATARIGNEPP